MKLKILLTTVALILGSGILLFALMYTPPSKTPSQTINQNELAKRDGLEGNECWVAVDGTVYSISGFSEWQMGKHIPSNGLATCGRDLSGVIGQSPHGKSVLSLLRKVGVYVP